MTSQKTRAPQFESDSTLLDHSDLPRSLKTPSDDSSGATAPRVPSSPTREVRSPSLPTPMQRWPARANQQTAALALHDGWTPTAVPQGQKCVIVPQSSGILQVVTGIVKVVANTSDGRSCVLKAGLPGDVMPFPFLISTVGKEVSFVAVTDSTVLTLAEQDLNVLAKDAGALRELLSLLTLEVRRASDRCMQQKLEDGHARAAFVICELAARLGERNDEGCVVLHHRLRGIDLAQLSGVSRETFSAIQRDFAARGWLQRGQASLTILDEAALRRRARLVPGP